MGVIVSRETYTRKVRDPEEEGVEYEVTLRLLNAGDRAEIDALAFEVGGTSETDARGSARHSVTAVKIKTVSKALVGWTVPDPPRPTPEIVAQLHPDFLDAIFAHVGFGTRPPEEGDPLGAPGDGA